MCPKNINRQRLQKENTKSAQTKQHKARKKLKCSPTILIKTSIILLLLLICSPIYAVVAISKGRLLSPSSFTALSGDLHVQIHYSVDDTTPSKNLTNDDNRTTTKLSSLPSFNKRPVTTAIIKNTTTTKTKTINDIENSTISVLVISKYIDETSGYNSRSNNNTKTNNTEQLLQRQRKEIVQNIPLFHDPRLNVTQIAVPCQTFVRGGGLYEMQVITNLKNTLPAKEFLNTTNETASPSSSSSSTMTTTTLMPLQDERLRQTLDVHWPSAVMEVIPTKFLTYPDHSVNVTLRFPEVNCDSALQSPELLDFWLEVVYCGKERTCSHNDSNSTSNVVYAVQVRGFPKYKIFQLNCNIFGLAGQYAVQLRPMQPTRNLPIIRRYLTIDWSTKFVFNVHARSIFPCDPFNGIGVLYEYPNCILDQGDRVRIYAKLRADVHSLKPPTSLHYVTEQRVVKSQHSLYFNCEHFSEKYIEYCFVYVSQAMSGAVANVREDCVPTLPVSDSDTGGWGPWSEWTPCSTNCLGTRNRYRFCDSPPPRYGAKFCEGSSVETEKCGEGIANAWSCIYQVGGNAMKLNTNVNHTSVISQEIGPGCRCGCIVHLGSSKPKRIIAGATQSCPGRSFWLIQVDGENNIGFSLNFLRLPCATQYIKMRDGPSLSSTLLIELNDGNLPTGGKRNLNMPVQLQTTGAQLLIEFFSGETWNNSMPNTCTGGFIANVEQIADADKNGTNTFLAANKLWAKSNVVAQKSKYRKTQFTLVHLSAVVFAAIIIIISGLLGAQYVVRYRKYHLAIAQRRDEGSRLHTPHASMNSLQSPPSRALSTTTLLSEVIYLVKMRPKHKLRHSILRESIDAENIGRETEFIGSNKLDVTSTHMTKCDEELGSNGTLVAHNEVASSPMSSISRSISTEDKFDDGKDMSGVEVVEEILSSHSGTLTHKDSAKDSESIISSGMSSIYNSPPMHSECLSKYSDRYDISTAKTIDSCLDDINLQKSDTIRLTKAKNEKNEFYSPMAANLFSTANVPTANLKQNKEQQNRRKLLIRPSSEFSLGTQQELEMDYYDYNVINAGAAPGSYLGMDPAYLVWIPPFDDAAILDADTENITTLTDKTHEIDEIDPLYEKLRGRMPKYYLSPRSNSESRTNTPTNQTIITSNSDDLSSNSSNHNQQMEMLTSKGFYLQRKKNRPKHSKSTLSLRPARAQFDLQTTQLNEFSSSPIGGTVPISTSDDIMTSSYVEKETTVVKSPSDLQNFLALDDIQYADESENDVDNTANILTLESKLHQNTKTKLPINYRHE